MWKQLSLTLSGAHRVRYKWKWLAKLCLGGALSLYVTGFACMWMCAHVIVTAHCRHCDGNFCMLETPWEWWLWKWRQEEARQSRNAHTQMTFDWLLFDETYQMCCDTLSLLFRKYTAMRAQNCDALGKFWLTDDTWCVWKIHLSSGITSSPL